MKQTLLVLTFVFASVGFLACGEENEPEDRLSLAAAAKITQECDVNAAADVDAIGALFIALGETPEAGELQEEAEEEIEELLDEQFDDAGFNRTRM